MSLNEGNGSSRDFGVEALLAANALLACALTVLRLDVLLFVCVGPGDLLLDFTLDELFPTS